MSKFLTTSEIVLLGGFGSLVCCIAAMVFEAGYRRGPVSIAVISILISALFPFFVYLMPNADPPVNLIALISGCMALASGFVVPALTIAGLCERTILLKTRLWHAALLVSGWILGVWVVLFGLVGGLH